MNIREYLFRQEITMSSFARKIDYERSYLSIVMKGKQKPGRKFIAAVERASNGNVTEEDILNNYKEKLLQRKQENPLVLNEE